jgi:hypothetical protein
MSDALEELVAFVQGFYEANLGCSKSVVAGATAQRFGLVRDRSLYVGPLFSVRFSVAGGTGLSNTILSLSALKPHDERPVIVCILRARTAEFLLANTTFLRKVSHSSHALSADKIRGSFNGSDIIREIDGIKNQPENFARLFAMHLEFSWEENLARLVEATGSIVGTGRRFVVGARERTTILAAPALAARLSSHQEYMDIGGRLQAALGARQSQVLAAGEIDNVNLRGNRIEQLLTDAGHFHRLDDIVFTLRIGSQVVVDIKTKVLALQASPKAYNIDKYLALLARGDTVMSFFFVGLDLAAHSVKSCFVSTLDHAILSATRVQHHWAGRNSRGVTQLTGSLPIFEAGFQEAIDIPQAQRFLLSFIDA